MEERANYAVTPVLPLTPRAESETIQPTPFDWRKYFEIRLRALQTEINLIRDILQKPQKCPHCGCELK